MLDASHFLQGTTQAFCQLSHPDYTLLSVKKLICSNSTLQEQKTTLKFKNCLTKWTEEVLKAYSEGVHSSGSIAFERLQSPPLVYCFKKKLERTVMKSLLCFVGLVGLVGPNMNHLGAWHRAASDIVFFWPPAIQQLLSSYTKQGCYIYSFSSVSSTFGILFLRTWTESEFNIITERNIYCWFCLIIFYCQPTSEQGAIGLAT